MKCFKNETKAGFVDLYFVLSQQTLLITMLKTKKCHKDINFIC